MLVWCARHRMCSAPRLAPLGLLLRVAHAWFGRWRGCLGSGGYLYFLEDATVVMPKGVFNHVMHWMDMAHSKYFDLIHDFSNNSSLRERVGISHHVSFMRPYGIFDVPAVVLRNSMTLFPYVDSISNKFDFLGINYYGQEVLSTPGLKLVNNDEYSESGRVFYPIGLYWMLLKFHERYKHLNIPFIITENGVSDATDLIHQPYILEHLLVVRATMEKGVQVLGYLFWTTSDNWEWEDGYGPKFGLVAIDRTNNLARIPRPSYFLFSEVVKTSKVTQQQREIAWNELQIVAAQGKTRPFYWELNKLGLMYFGGLRSNPDVTVNKYTTPSSLTSITGILGSIQTIVLTTVLVRGINPTSWVLYRSRILTIVYVGIALSLQLWCMQKRGLVFIIIFNLVATMCSRILSSLFLGDTLHMGR